MVKRGCSTNQQYPSCFRLQPASRIDCLPSVDVERYVNPVRILRTTSQIRRKIAHLNNWYSGKNLGRYVTAKYDNIDLPFGILRTKFTDLTLLVFRESSRVQLLSVELQVRAHGGTKTLHQALLERNICWNGALALVHQENSFGRCSLSECRGRDPGCKQCRRGELPQI